MGGTAIHDLGFSFVLLPVAVNALSMVVLAVILNLPFRWRRYPSAWRPLERPAVGSAGSLPPSPSHEDIVSAVRSLDTFVDIAEDDLLRLIELIHRPPGGGPGPPPA